MSADPTSPRILHEVHVARSSQPHPPWRAESKNPARLALVAALKALDESPA